MLCLQELVAKGVIEASEEEMDDLVKADIVRVATFCNQHSFSGEVPTLLPGSVCNCVSRSDNSKASLPGSLPQRTEELASLHPQPGQVDCYWSENLP